MPEIKTSIRTVATKSMQLALTGEQIRTALANTGVDIPKNATIQFVVPGGGNWSGMAMDIDAENPIQIEWSETTDSDV